MMIIFLDVDETLVTHNKKPSTELINALDGLADAHKVVLMTARPYNGLRTIYKQFGRSFSCIVLNGAGIFIMVDEVVKEYWFTPIDNITLIQIIDRFYDDPDTVINGYGKRRWFVNRINKWTEEEICAVNVNPEIVKKEGFYENEIYKITLINKNKDIYSELIKSNILLLNICCQQSNAGYVEINNNLVNKGIAVKFIISNEFVLPSRDAYIISIGDGHNDIPAFKCSNLSYAMPNSEQLVKKEASFVLYGDTEEAVTSLLNILKKINIVNRS